MGVCHENSDTTVEIKHSS